MSKYTIELNQSVPYNYSFFCPDSGLHLDIIRPVATIELETLTPSILRGLKAETLIDVDGTIELNKCPQCNFVEQAPPKEDVVDPSPEPPPPNPDEGTGEDGGGR